MVAPSADRKSAWPPLTVAWVPGLAWAAWWTWDLLADGMTLYGLGSHGTFLLLVIPLLPGTAWLGWQLYQPPAAPRGDRHAFWLVLVAGIAVLSLTPEFWIPDEWTRVWQEAGTQAIVRRRLLSLPSRVYVMLGAFTLYSVPAAATLLVLAVREDWRQRGHRRRTIGEAMEGPA
jgi:hypothetical protein